MTAPPDDEDPVIGEIDIHLALPPADTGLHLFQYPLRPPHIPVNHERPISKIEIRPKHNTTQVHIAVRPPCDTPSFDDNQPDVLRKDIGETQVLRSKAARAMPEANFAVGGYVPPSDGQQGVFRLVPLQCVSVLRPAFDYVDERDLQHLVAKAQAKLQRERARGEVKEEPKKSAAVQMSFRKRETERAAERRKNSYAFLREEEEADKWVELSYVSEKGDDGRRAWNSMFGDSDVVMAESKPDITNYDQAGYVDLFRAHTSHGNPGFQIKGSVDTEAVTTAQLKRLSLEAAVKLVIKQTRIVSFESLRELVGMNHNVSEVLSHLRRQALCLRGNWVCRTAIPRGGMSAAASKRFEACRILVLTLFRETAVLSVAAGMDALGQTPLITSEGVEGVLKEVAERRRGVGWEVRLPDDDSFLDMHEDLVKAQESEWDSLVNGAKDTLQRCLTGQSNFKVR